MKANTKLFLTMTLAIAAGVALENYLQRNPTYKAIVG